MNANTDSQHADGFQTSGLHEELFNAVRVGGLDHGERLGAEAILNYQKRVGAVFDQMLALAEMVDNPRLYAEVEGLKQDYQKFYYDAFKAFKKRFKSARDLVEGNRVNVRDAEFATDHARDDAAPVHEFVEAPDTVGSIEKTSTDGRDATESRYSVAWCDGVPVVPTGDMVYRPHVILDKYALAIALASNANATAGQNAVPTPA